MLLEKETSGHTDLLTEAGPLIDEINEIREIQNEQHYRNAPDKLKKKDFFLF